MCSLAGDECGLKVVAADGTGVVEDFAAQVKAAALDRAHGLGVDFIERDSAGDDLAFVEDDFRGPAELESFEGRDQLGSLRAGEA